MKVGLPFTVEFQHKKDCCWVVVNLATDIYCGYYHISYIGVSVSQKAISTSNYMMVSKHGQLSLKLKPD